MALIDIVKCEANSKELVTRFSSDDLRIGTQLVVHPGQIAYFVKGGAIYDQFNPGTYTLSTNNLPLLNKIINLPFGGESPFQAEVWFINTLNILDNKWGTKQPIQIEDPKYNIIVPVRAYGQYGIKISNSKIFIETLVGNMRSFTQDKIDEYFRGKILSSVANLVSVKMAQDNISFLNINSHINELSEYLNTQINKEFMKFGIETVNFYIIAISIPDNDPSLIKLKEAKDLAARLRITGKDVYQMERSYDVLEKAASNEGAGGSMMTIGAGLGAGVGIGSTISDLYAKNILTKTNIPPSISRVQTWFAYIDEQQKGGLSKSDIILLIEQGKISSDTLVWTKGMREWCEISHTKEFGDYFEPNTPPPIISK